MRAGQGQDVAVTQATAQTWEAEPVFPHIRAGSCAESRLFWSSDQDSSGMYVPGPLLGISGTSPDDLVVVGTDAMYRWKTSTPVPIPGIDKQAGNRCLLFPGGFFAVSQRSMTDPMGRVYYMIWGP